MEFKKLSEVTQLEEVPEGASVLATTAEGEVVRVPGDGLGGGGGALIVTFSSADGQSYTADKTFAEVAAAIEAGEQAVLGRMSTGTMAVGLTLFQYQQDTSAAFQLISYMSGLGIMFATLALNADDTITYTPNTVTL